MILKYSHNACVLHMIVVYYGQKEVFFMAQISLRVDDDVKRSAEKIPFELTADPFYAESNLRYLEIIMRDVKDGKAHFTEHDLIEEE